ncbi:MAG: DNA-3-methyladenine glycosylase 2 family protein, partial [Chloroflexi bacterium]|nr:DNA-3-methyladenine glycosylase 2 family protein [Chloroflexota bacterium]
MDPRRRLTDAVLGRAVDELAARDRDLAAIVARHGPPPLWDRAPG